MTINLPSTGPSSLTGTRSRTLLSVIIIAFALPALLTTLLYRDPMPVSYVCMGCQEGSRVHFTDFKSASIHYARSATCNRSNRGIGTIVLPNKATDQEAGGSGGAGAAWTGQAHPRRPHWSQGAIKILTMILIHILFHKLPKRAHVSHHKRVGIHTSLNSDNVNIISK